MIDQSKRKRNDYVLNFIQILAYLSQSEAYGLKMTHIFILLTQPLKMCIKNDT